jgi:hypothetical protein
MLPGEIDRFERAAPWCAGAFLALPVLIAKFPPMADVPLHEASVGLLRHWGDRVFAPPSIYFVNLGHSNQLFSFLVFALSLALPIAWATKLVVAAAVAALPVAAARFADHVGAPRWTALLVAPMGLGWLFFWGLIQNIIGLSVLLASLPAIDAFATRPTGRGALRVCAALVLLHFAHQAMQLVACAAIGFCGLGASWSLRATGWRCMPVAFGIGVVYAAHQYAWHFAGPVHQGTAPYLWVDLWHKVDAISGVLFGGFEPYIRNLILLLACIPVVWSLVVRCRARRGPRDESRWARLHAWRFEIFTLALLAIYFAAPANIKSTTLVYHRFLPPAWAIFAVSAATGTASALRAVPRLICAALPIASVLVAWPSFVDSHRVYSGLAEVMKHMERGSSVACVDLGPDPPYRLWSPVAAMGHIVAEHGGRSLYDYSQSPISIVSQRPEKQWADIVERATGRLYMIRPEWDLKRFRYLLIWTSQPTVAIAASLALRDDAKFVASSRDWYLFESTHTLVPIDSDDVPMTRPFPPSLRKLMDTVRKEIEDADRDGKPVAIPEELLQEFAH